MISVTRHFDDFKILRATHKNKKVVSKGLMKKIF